MKRQEEMAKRQQEIQKEAQRQKKEAAERKFQERKEQREQRRQDEYNDSDGIKNGRFLKNLSKNVLASFPANI